MSAEYAAEVIVDAIEEKVPNSTGFTIDEDLRSGGFFFEVNLKGRTYEVLVIEFVGGDR